MRVSMTKMSVTVSVVMVREESWHFSSLASRNTSCDSGRGSRSSRMVVGVRGRGVHAGGVAGHMLQLLNRVLRMHLRALLAGQIVTTTASTTTTTTILCLLLVMHHLPIPCPLLLPL